MRKRFLSSSISHFCGGRENLAPPEPKKVTLKNEQIKN